MTILVIFRVIKNGFLYHFYSSEHEVNLPNNQIVSIILHSTISTSTTLDVVRMSPEVTGDSPLFTISTPRALESITDRQELLSKFCQNRRGREPHRWFTVLYQDTTELFCLNPKTGSTSLKVLLHMKFTNKTSLPSDIASGKG